MRVGRREFLKTGVLAGGAAAAGAAVKLAGGTSAQEPTPVPGEVALTPDGRLITVGGSAAEVRPAAPPTREGVDGRRWVMVIDLARCDGCDKCVEACREHHGIPSDQEWIRIYKMQDSSETAPYWFPKPCFHCDNPPCAKVCPVGATFKRTDGLVLIDTERCIGCRFCMAACPYSSRVFNWKRPDPDVPVHDGVPRRMGTVEKCDFCVGSIAEGELPHCVSTCTLGATYFGDANEDAVTNGRGETARLSDLLHDRAGYRFLEDLGTEPRVFYLPPSGRRYRGPARRDAAVEVAS